MRLEWIAALCGNINVIMSRPLCKYTMH